MEFLEFLEEENNHTYKPDNCKSKFKIKDIFNDHWYSFLEDNPNLNIRPVVHEEVEKMMGCGSLSNGYAVYTCEHCHNYLYVPFTCKSRFCCSCGTKYTLDRADTIARKSINCPHRHITFTIHQDLWPLFQKDRSLLNLLFDAVSSTILSWFFDQNHKENFTPGFISTLHTFGRDLKWNPHIHVLITEGAAGNFTPWKKFEVFPYTMLRNRFQSTLLFILEKHFGKKKFKSLKNHIYKTSKNGFYVHAPKIKARNIKSTVKYVIRYSGKPAMAQSRILDYDGEYVTFWYDRHEDNQRVEETIHAYEFIKRLIIHIYDKYFNVVRYYGLYAKKHKFSDKFIYMLKPHVAKFRKQLKNWRCRIELYFHLDPLKCSCGHTFHFDYIVKKSYNTS